MHVIHKSVTLYKIVASKEQDADKDTKNISYTHEQDRRNTEIFWNLLNLQMWNLLVLTGGTLDADKMQELGWNGKFQKGSSVDAWIS